MYSLYKDNLSENAKKRLKILKKTNDGFQIAEEDLKLRGHGDFLDTNKVALKILDLLIPYIIKIYFF